MERSGTTHYPLRVPTRPAKHRKVYYPVGEVSVEEGSEGFFFSVEVRVRVGSWFGVKQG